jgi:hypothetical protein
MAEAPFHNEESFERAIAALIDKTDAANRGDDLDRLANHVLTSTPEVSKLASLMFMIDEDFRPMVEQEVEAYRRWLKKKGKPSDDQSIYDALMAAYRRKRGIKES